MRANPKVPVGPVTATVSRSSGTRRRYPNADRLGDYLHGVADPDDGICGLDDLDVLARLQGVVPAFRWPGDAEEELEGCFLRLHREDATADGLMVLEIGALDGSWTDQFLVGAEHFEAAASRPVD